MSDLDFWFLFGSCVALLIAVIVGESTSPILRRKRKR